jgi:predicted dehydrogenase
VSRAVLIAGFGRRGRQWLGALGRGSGARVIAVADPAPEARAQAERLRLRAHPDLSQALERERPELAIVASRAPEHQQCALACVEAGVPVLVEKPLAPSLAAAAEIAEASRRADVPVLAAQNFRFLRQELTVAAALARGDIGAPRNVARISARTPRGEGADSLEIALSALWEFGIHALDQFVVRFGGPPESVAGELVGGSESFMLRLEWPGQLQVLYRHEDAAPLFHHYEWLQGEEAGLSVEGERVTLRSVRHRPRRMRRARAPAPERTLLHQLERAVGSGEPGPLGAEANLATVGTAEAAAAALRTGGTEPVRFSAA